jgi:ornithine carbamoyltransferase
MKHFLSLADLTPKELIRLLDLAVALKKEWKNGKNPPYLQGKTLGMLFTKPSLRTRVSFDMAMLQLGGHALYLSPNEISLGQRESVADVARVLGRYVDAIMARVFGHRDVLELARYAPTPVINGLSDYSHPCQALADLLTLYERFGKLKGVKVAYVGDGNNVANSLIFGCALVGADFAIASPIGYEITGDVVAKAQAFAAKSGSSLYFSHDPNEAVREADVIYTDVWASMGQEAETQKRLEVFSPRYQINTALVAKAKRNAIVMHCLPAHRGQEITDEVADGPQSALWDQAENRLHAQKAILVELLAPDGVKHLRALAGIETAHSSRFSTATKGKSAAKIAPKARQAGKTRAVGKHKPKVKRARKR